MKPNSFRSLVAAMANMSGEQGKQKKFNSKKLEIFWDNLETEQQHKFFLIVTEKLLDGISQGLTYREILYNVFEFESDMFDAGQQTGLKEFIEELKDNFIDYDSINRVEVIDENGRAYVNMSVETLTSSVQDNGQTLKLFVSTS